MAETIRVSSRVPRRLSAYVHLVGWVVLLLSGSPGAAEARTRYVLLLHSFDRHFASFDTFVNVFRTELSRQSPDPVVFFEASLQLGRDSQSPDDAVVEQYLQSALGQQHVDLVVSIGGPAAVFAQKHVQQLFPTTPVLFAAVDQRFLQTNRLVAGQTAVPVKHEPVVLVNNILHVLPDVTHILVVVGDSPLDRSWKTEMERQFEVFKSRLTFTWADEFSFSQLVRHAATLPPHSAILFTLFAVDTEGGPYTEEQALGEIHGVANAPIFGFHTPQLGHGIVGGPLIPVEELGRRTTGVALRILRGESDATQIAPLTEAPPTFDWRELRRWNIAENQLPPGSTVRFREPTVWEKYRREIVAAGAFILLLVLLVGTLVVNQIRRRRTERLLRESEARFRLFADTAPVMIWMSGPDRLCTDVNRPWLEFTGRTLAAELGNGWAQGVHPADRDRCISSYVNAFDRRQRFEMDYRLRRADGAYRWILDCGAPRFLPDGSFVGYIGSAVDITDQKLAKSMLTDFNHKLIEAQELERARIARELHDDLGQRVAGVTMLLYSLTPGRGKERDTTRATLTQLCGQLAEVTEAMTSISTRLHPPFLDLLGLSGAAAVLCKETSEQDGVQVDFRGENVPRDLPQDLALGLFRVLQEALANAVKHSGAQHVDVVLRGHGRGIQLDVIDRGVGFDPTVTTNGEGLGLFNMRERLSLIKGELVIESRPGSGTRIRAVARLSEAHSVEAETHVAV
jgi:PAS domain S-box-containing protein